MLPNETSCGQRAGHGPPLSRDVTVEKRMASFSTDGIYVLHLEASNGEFIVSDDLSI